MSAPLLYDGASIAILGGGCAGLSLALELAEKFPGIDIAILEARRELTHDRTWCFWQFESGRFDPLVTHRWNTCIVGGGGRVSRLDCRSTPYCHIPSGKFYEWALHRLERLGRVQIEFGVRASTIEEQDSGVQLLSSDGEGSRRREFSMVFDGRPPERASNADRRFTLSQHFLGREVIFADDRLDPKVVTLMDFDVDQAEGLHFMYMLPYSPRHALIESTFMTPPGAPMPDYDRHIENYLERYVGSTPVQTLRAERGRLPMHVGRLSARATRRVWPIGTRGGAGRPSTGYAFEAIQRDTASVCHALLNGLERPTPPRSNLMGLLDRILLTLLAREPERGPELFTTLFQRAPDPSLLRFLCDRASNRDIFSVIKAMPKWLVTRHVVTAPHLCLQ